MGAMKKLHDIATMRSKIPEDLTPDVLKLRGPEKPGIKRAKEEDRHPNDQLKLKEKRTKWEGVSKIAFW